MDECEFEVVVAEDLFVLVKAAAATAAAVIVDGVVSGDDLYKSV